MRDVIFLFGAGASFGAGGIIPGRPPLGKNLYGELSRLFPHSWGALPLDMIELFRTNFELGMAAIHEKAGILIPQLMREMAIYFVQFRPINADCQYRVLIRRLREADLLGRVAFSTLNYECTLEFSLTAEGESLSYFEQNPEGGIPVWKPHGSCNFFSQDVQMSQQVLYSTGVTIEGGIKALTDIGAVVQHCLTGTGLAPVMNLYMAGKPLAVSPSGVAQVQQWWNESVKNAKYVIVAGVHPNPSDTHLWLPLSETSATLLFIGNQLAFETWSASHRKSPSKYLSASLESGITPLITTLLS